MFSNSTDFFFYPPITANLDFDILFDKPKLSEQTLPHQWRFICLVTIKNSAALATPQTPIVIFEVGAVAD